MIMMDLLISVKHTSVSLILKMLGELIIVMDMDLSPVTVHLMLMHVQVLGVVMISHKSLLNIWLMLIPILMDKSIPAMVGLKNLSIKLTHNVTMMVMVTLIPVNSTNV